MGVINWTSFYLGKNINANSKEKERILECQSVRNLSLKEVRRIATLDDNERETSMLSVYASKKFNSNEADSFTGEEKERTINILFDANGDKQFTYACNVICNTRSSRNENVIESVALVAGAEHPFQSEFSSFIALDSTMQRHESFIRIIRVLTLLGKDKAIRFYDYIKMLENSDIDTYQISKLVSEKLKEYESLMGIKQGSASKIIGQK